VKLIRSPIFIIFLFLGMVLAIFFMKSIGAFNHDMLHVADYPGAQQVQVEVADEIRGSAYYNVRKPYKTVKFATSDNSERVFAFYKNDLTGRLTEDWRTNNPYEEEPGHLVILGYDRGERSSPVYIFEIKTEQKDGFTHVTIERSFEYGI
jgi:hypothetical protein